MTEQSRMPLGEILIVAALVLSFIGVTFAAVQKPDPLRNTGFHAIAVPLPDGRRVICVTFYQAGVSCDWEHAR